MKCIRNNTFKSIRSLYFAHLQKSEKKRENMKDLGVIRVLQNLILYPDLHMGLIFI
jgi:hypothetical protein